MALYYINTGTSPNSGDGDTLRTAFTKINYNFGLLDALVGMSTSTSPKIATTTALGSIIVGHNLTVDSTGVLNAVPVVVSDTPPADPRNGDIWWNSDNGASYTYVSDTSSSQWVSLSIPGPEGPPGPAGTGTNTGTVAQLTFIAGTDTSISKVGNTVTVWNTGTLQTITDRANSTTNALLFLNTATSTSTTTGALVISGGVGIGGNLYGTALYDDNARVITTATIGMYLGGSSVIPRQVYMYTTPVLQPQESVDFTATIGTTVMCYSLTVSTASTVESYCDRTFTDTNPYRFIAVSGHLSDDGTSVMSDGNTFYGQRTFILSNLDSPPSQNTYWRITNTQPTSQSITMTLNYRVIE